MDTNPGFTNLSNFDARFPDEQTCREYLEKVRWHGEITCPYCSGKKVYKFKDGKNYKCSACRKRFSVKVGTIFEDSPLPLRKWFLALYIATAHKKGISSMQLAKDLGVTQKTAWFMLGRIRYAIRSKSFTAPLKGTVELDETYVGPKSTRKHAGTTGRKTRGRGTEAKVPVYGMVERGGSLFTRPVPNVTGDTLRAITVEAVSPSATIVTDQFQVYNKVGREFAAHKTVNHARHEYVRYEEGLKVHTNTIEGAFSLLKRSIIGIYHHVSPEHLHRYCAETDYRYNTRKMKDPERFVVSLGRIQDRLTYKELIAYGVRATRTKKAAEETGG